jgi:hypothetical protein
VRAVQRAQIDHHHGVPAEPLRQRHVTLHRDVPFGVRHDGEEPIDAQLEQLVLEADRHELRVHLEQERRSAAVDGDGSLAQPIVEHAVPEIFGAQTQAHGDAPGRDVGRHGCERGRDRVAGRQEHAAALVRRGVKVAEAERGDGTHHLQRHLAAGRTVVQRGQVMRVKIDESAHVTRLSSRNDSAWQGTRKKLSR